MTHVHDSDYEQQLRLAEFSFECTSIAAFWITRQGAILRVNQAACDSLGYSQDELQALTVFDIDPNASPQTWPGHWQKLQTHKKLTFNSNHCTKNGEVKEVAVTVNFLKLGAQEFNFAFAQDLTAQRDAEKALKETQERHALVIQAANDGIWDWDVKSQQIYFSERWFKMLGLESPQPHQTLEGWLSRIHIDDQSIVQLALENCGNGTIKQLDIEFRILHQKDYYIWVLCRGLALYDFNNDIYRVAGSLTDITAQHEAQEQLIHDALHDPLTGLPNRHLLLTQLEEIIQPSNASHQSGFAILFLDLDRFKVVNDSLGHRAGDELLIEIAHRLKQSVEPQHIIARLGGDEFIVVLKDNAQPHQVTQVAKNILTHLSHPVFLGTQTVYPKVSIGISLGHPQTVYQNWPTEHRSLLAEDYLQQADIAMYQAKKSHHSRYALFTQDMQATVIQRLQLEVDLQAAIEQGEFRLVYQPIVDLYNGNLIGFEALLRWHHPIRGLIGPDIFIPIAEETGLIIPLGDWALRHACEQMSRWQKLPHCPSDLFVTVNLASSHIMQPDFVDKVLAILNQTSVKPWNIKLEITESAIIENKDFAREQILALKNNQIKICMDDFGTGYSSLGYLHQLPIDCLKIDKSFVQQIHSQEDKPEIIRAILAIAQSLNMKVIAEGIETIQQAKLLKDIDCPCGQGYLFSKPLSSVSATRQIKSTLQNSASTPGQFNLIEQLHAC